MSRGVRGEEEGRRATAHPRGCLLDYEKELITISSHFKQQREPTLDPKTGPLAQFQSLTEIEANSF